MGQEISEAERQARYKKVKVKLTNKCYEIHTCVCVGAYIYIVVERQSVWAVF
jgi:hypothetical protein